MTSYPQACFLRVVRWGHSPACRHAMAPLGEGRSMDPPPPCAYFNFLLTSRALSLSTSLSFTLLSFPWKGHSVVNMTPQLMLRLVWRPSSVSNTRRGALPYKDQILSTKMCGLTDFYGLKNYYHCRRTKLVVNYHPVVKTFV